VLVGVGGTGVEVAVGDVVGTGDGTAVGVSVNAGEGPRVMVGVKVAVTGIRAVSAGITVCTRGVVAKPGVATTPGSAVATIPGRTVAIADKADMRRVASTTTGVTSGQLVAWTEPAAAAVCIAAIRVASATA